MKLLMLSASFLVSLAAVCADREISYLSTDGSTVVRVDDQVFAKYDEARMMCAYFSESGDWVYVKFGDPNWAAGELQSIRNFQLEAALPKSFFKTYYVDEQHSIGGAKLVTTRQIRPWDQEALPPGSVQQLFDDVSFQDLALPEPMENIATDHDDMVLFERMGDDGYGPNDTLTVYQEIVVIDYTDHGIRIESGYDHLTGETVFQYEDGFVSTTGSTTKDIGEVRVNNSAVVTVEVNTSAVRDCAGLLSECNNISRDCSALARSSASAMRMMSVCLHAAQDPSDCDTVRNEWQRRRFEMDQCTATAAFCYTRYLLCLARWG